MSNPNQGMEGPNLQSVAVNNNMRLTNTFLDVIKQDLGVADDLMISIQSLQTVNSGEKYFIDLLQ